MIQTGLGGSPLAKCDLTSVRSSVLEANTNRRTERTDRTERTERTRRSYSEIEQSRPHVPLRHQVASCIHSIASRGLQDALQGGARQATVGHSLEDRRFNLWWDLIGRFLSRREIQTVDQTAKL